MPENPFTADDTVPLRRRAYLLQHLNAAPGGKLTRGEANRKIHKQVGHELGLTADIANEERAALAALGLIAVRAARNSVAYEITGEGRAWLAEHPQDFPKAAPARVAKRKTASKPQSLADVPLKVSQQAFILLHLLDAPSEGRSPSHFSSQAGSSEIDLKPVALVGPILAALVEDGFVSSHGKGRAVKFTVTPAGESRCLSLSFEGLPKLTVSGAAIAKLIRLVSTIARAETTDPHVPQPAPPSTSPTVRELEAAVLDACAEVKRDMNTRLAPIHRVRALVRGQWGEAVSRDSFDEAVLDLRRAKRVRMISISDKGGATAEQLRDSIVLVGETFFYLESADDSAPG